MLSLLKRLSTNEPKYLNTKIIISAVVYVIFLTLVAAVSSWFFVPAVIAFLILGYYSLWKVKIFNDE